MTGYMSATGVRRQVAGGVIRRSDDLMNLTPQVRPGCSAILAISRHLVGKVPSYGNSSLAEAATSGSVPIAMTQRAGNPRSIASLRERISAIVHDHHFTFC